MNSLTSACSAAWFTCCFLLFLFFFRFLSSVVFVSWDIWAGASWFKNKMLTILWLISGSAVKCHSLCYSHLHPSFFSSYLLQCPLFLYCHLMDPHPSSYEVLISTICPWPLDKLLLQTNTSVYFTEDQHTRFLNEVHGRTRLKVKRNKLSILWHNNKQQVYGLNTTLTTLFLLKTLNQPELRCVQDSGKHTGAWKVNQEAVPLKWSLVGRLATRVLWLVGGCNTFNNSKNKLLKENSKY